MNKELDLNKVNTAIKVEMWDIQQKIAVLQQRLQYLAEMANKQMVEEIPEKKDKE